MAVAPAATALREAAFFDLDKTLMAGSSGIFFARAAYESGMISRRRLARDAYENLRFRLRGSTDDRADEVRRRVCIRRCWSAPMPIRTPAGWCTS
jgi:phosphoserine phosphatase